MARGRANKGGGVCATQCKFAPAPITNAMITGYERTRSNENKMSDGGRGRASLGVEIWWSSQKWGAQRSAVRSIAWLGRLIMGTLRLQNENPAYRVDQAGHADLGQ